VADEMFSVRIVPVVVLNDAKDAEPLGRALIAGGPPRRRGDVPYGSGCRLDPRDVGGRGADRGRRYGAQPGAGRPGRRRGCPVHRQPRASAVTWSSRPRPPGSPSCRALRRRRARRGDAAPRPRRGPHPHGAAFRVWEGGGEYNVAAACAALRPARRGRHGARDNEIGRLVEDFILTGGLDTSTSCGSPTTASGVGAQRAELHRARLRRARGGRRLRPRPHGGSQLKPGDVDWDHLFGDSACAGCTPAASSRRCPSRPPTSSRRSPRPAEVRHRRLLRPQLPPQPVEGDRRQAKAQEVNKEIAGTST
jgi:hypothetical protein